MESPSSETQALCDLFLVDEYFVFALPRKGGGLAGFLVAGNTKEQARFQTQVDSEGEMLVAFTNLAGQTATVISNVAAYRALERERQMLDEMVADRTRELSEALETAHEAVRVKAEFLANVSHELRTPLNSIVNVPAALIKEYTEIELYQCDSCGAQFQAEGEAGDEDCPDCGAALKRARSVACMGDPAEHKRFLKLLLQQGAHLLGLVEDVLDFSRIESGRVELAITEVDLGDLVTDIRTTLESANQGTTRSLAYPAFEGRHKVCADRMKLKQVLLNLLGNAIKFTDESGTITLSILETHNGSPRVEFAVTDDGIGIPADHIESIFESFHQVDASHTRAYGGAGLGLAICRQLVELHGGEISVESEIGRGSSFRFWLPKEASLGRRVSDLPPRPESLQPTPAAAAAHGRVVVVDDEPAQLSMARKLLEREGYEVQLVSKPQHAVEIIRQAQPRFVLLDIMMPEVNGFWVLDQLKHDDATRRIPVIVSTAYHYNKKKAKEVGGIWLPKPWSAERMSARNLESLLEEAEENARGNAGEVHHKKKKLSELVSRVLYVEDEDANWDVTALSLRGKYQLTRARDSRETYELLSKNTYDLILMDVQLAGSDLNGIEMCEALTGKRVNNVPEYAKGVRCDTPIVIVTAYASLYSKEELLQSGARDFVTKPVDFTHLLIVLSRLMVKGAISELRDE